MIVKTSISRLNLWNFGSDIVKQRRLICRSITDFISHGGKLIIKNALCPRSITGKRCSVHSKYHCQITTQVMINREKLTSSQQLLQISCSVRMIEGLHGDINDWANAGSWMLSGGHVRIFSGGLSARSAPSPFNTPLIQPYNRYNLYLRIYSVYVWDLRFTVSPVQVYRMEDTESCWSDDLNNPQMMAVVGQLNVSWRGWRISKRSGRSSTI